MERGPPALSVVVVATDGFGRVRRTIEHLRAQTTRDLLELILVVSSEQALADAAPGDLEGFHDARVVAVGPIDNADRAAAPGLLAATAPVVALVEDHAYPEPDWAEAVLRAHQGPWAVVGSTMLNANPATTVSWTNLLLAYGSWTEPADGGEVETLPGHNVAYKTDVLRREYGEGLVTMLGREGGLLQDLRRRGYRLYLAGDARLAHANPSRLAPTAELRFGAGRLYGATRAGREGWSPAKRLLYVALGPLIPLVRFRRLHAELFGGGKRRELAPRVFPALLMGLGLDALGQMVGYAAGPGHSRERLARFEMGRMRHLTARDRRALEGAPPTG